jgi:hypothetical protein
VNGALVGSGQLNSVAGGSSGFNNAKLSHIPLTLGAPVSVFPGDTLGAGLGEDEQAIDWLEGAVDERAGADRS